MEPHQSDMPKLPRLTFEEVMDNQTRLIDKIEQMVKESRTLKPDERKEFRQIYYRSTLGLGASVHPTFEPEEDVHLSETLDEIVFNCLSSPKALKIFIDDGLDERKKMEPDVLWEAILKSLQKNVFGNALQEALKISPEREGGVVHAGTRTKPE